MLGNFVKICFVLLSSTICLISPASGLLPQKLPSISLPNLTVPNLSLPNLSVPNLSVPNLSLPDLSVHSLTSLPKPDLPVPSLVTQPKPDLPGPFLVSSQKPDFPGPSFTSPPKPEFLGPSFTSPPKPEFLGPSFTSPPKPNLSLPNLSSLINPDVLKSIGNKLQKLMQVLIPPLPQPLPPVHLERSFACANETLMMACPPGNQIYVLNVEYGRYTDKICPSYDPSMNNNVCMSKAGTTEAVQKLCNQRDNCAVPVTDDVLGENCPETAKYATVIYECLKYERACEGSNVVLKCPPGTTVSIYEANYGRTLPGSIACPAANSDVTDCISGNAVAMSQSICDGHSSCVIPASTDMFGDTCEGTFKYLEVRYLCE